MERELLRRRADDASAQAAARADAAEGDKRLAELELERLRDRVASLEREVAALLAGPAEAGLHYRARIALLEATRASRPRHPTGSPPPDEDARELARLQAALARLAEPRKPV